MIDKKFGRLTVIEKAEKKVGNGAYWKCLCICGNTCFIDQWRLKTGRTTSCGCWRNEKNATRHIKHGRRYSRAYNSWAAMKQRCTNPKTHDWRYYGGRGVTVCGAWLIFENFLADMGEPAADLTIDRIDPEGNYEPSNCRWATRKEQRENQRKKAA